MTRRAYDCYDLQKTSVITCFLGSTGSQETTVKFSITYLTGDKVSYNFLYCCYRVVLIFLVRKE